MNEHLQVSILACPHCHEPVQVSLSKVPDAYAHLGVGEQVFGGEVVSTGGNVTPGGVMHSGEKVESGAGGNDPGAYLSPPVVDGHVSGGVQETPAGIHNPGAYLSPPVVDGHDPVVVDETPAAISDPELSEEFLDSIKSILVKKVMDTITPLLQKLEEARAQIEAQQTPVQQPAPQSGIPTSRLAQQQLRGSIESMAQKQLQQSLDQLAQSQTQLSQLQTVPQASRASGDAEDSVQSPLSYQEQVKQMQEIAQEKIRLNEEKFAQKLKQFEDRTKPG